MATLLRRCLSASRTLAQSLVVSVTAWVSHFPFFFFFFSFFSFGFSVFAFSFWFWTAEAEIFSFFFFFFFLLWIDMGYGLMSSTLGWPWLDDGLGERGPEQKFQGGPSPYFFFFGNFLLAKKFFFWAQGGLGPP